MMPATCPTISSTDCSAPSQSPDLILPTSPRSDPATSRAMSAKLLIILSFAARTFDQRSITASAASPASLALPVPTDPLPGLSSNGVFPGAGLPFSYAARALDRSGGEEGQV